eukprot:1816744-Amphidinium_carterae.1
MGESTLLRSFVDNFCKVFELLIGDLRMHVPIVKQMDKSTETGIHLLCPVEVHHGIASLPCPRLWHCA